MFEIDYPRWPPLENHDVIVPLFDIIAKCCGP